MISSIDSRRHPIIFFDGECLFCHGRVNWIIQRDKGRVFRFSPLKSPFAAEALRQSPLGSVSFDTIVLMEDGQWVTQSTAVLRILRRLPGIWKWLSLLLGIPRPIRDGIYRWVARNRYRYRFKGRTDRCLVPTPDVRARFFEFPGDDVKERANS